MDISLIKKLREETGAGVSEVKQALEDSSDNYEKAHRILMDKVSSKAAKKADRIIKDGLIHSYVHATGKTGSLVYLGCETDFVAKTDAFKTLIHDISLQICTEDYTDVQAVLESEFIKDPSKKIQDLINEVIAKTGEKVELVRFCKFSVGE